MDINTDGGLSVANASNLNVILGKNGCGKSYLLKELERKLQHLPGAKAIRYISPERGGVMKYEPNIDASIMSSPQWMSDVRRTNQSPNFRGQSAVLFRRLELLVLRKIESENLRGCVSDLSFPHKIDRMNSLLDRVKIVRDDQAGFKIIDKVSGADTPPESISSGEAELISLGIEILSFAAEAIVGSQNVLFIDEPDVHLHPDLQFRL